MKVPSSRTLQPGVVIFLVVGVLVLALSGYLTPISRIILGPFVGIQTWISQRYQAVQEYITAPGDLTRLRQRNAELEAENSRLQIQIIELQQQVVEAEVLSTLVNFARGHAENRYSAASVIGYDTSPFKKYVIINKGSDDGFRRGMPVVTDKGLVGQITAVTANASRVELIIDPASAVNVYLQKADSEAMLNGLTTGNVELNMIPQSATVQPGDLIVTSGLGGNYPSNIVVGQVTDVRKRDFDLFQTAGVQPAVDFENLEIVLVIINFQPVDITPLLPTPQP
jgi:rod shape-determining protein MreC